MSLVQELQQVIWKITDVLDPFKSYSQFGLKLRKFQPPGRRTLEKLPKIAILTPLKNAEAFLPKYFRMVSQLDYPRSHLHLRLLEGDSSDRSFAEAQAHLRSFDCASTDLIKFDLHFDAGSGPRARKEIQGQRRSAIAACRNQLLKSALETDAEFFLFIDVDMVAIAPSTIRDLLKINAPILMPNCLHEGSKSFFDRNAYFMTRPITDRMARRFVADGVYQPPGGYFRRYPNAVSGPDIMPVHTVGGTCLLIERQVIDAGADFPETPYHLHLETEGFALMAAELGYGSYVATRIHVFHGPN